VANLETAGREARLLYDYPLSANHYPLSYRPTCHPLALHTESPVPRTPISTPDAPKAIGTYSQAVRSGNTVYLSGQIPLDPASGQLVEGNMEAQIRRVFDNLKAVAVAAGGDLSDVVKLNVFLTDLGHFQLVNQVMAEYFTEPYPARAAIGVAALPRGAAVEMDCVLEL
jgi:reactive intermediate/imine deaminase